MTKLWLPDDSVSLEMARREQARELDRQRAEQRKLIAEMPHTVTVLGRELKREFFSPDVAFYGNQHGLHLVARCWVRPESVLTWDLSCSDTDAHGDCSECEGSPIAETTGNHSTLEACEVELRGKLETLHSELGRMLGKS